MVSGPKGMGKTFILLLCCVFLTVLKVDSAELMLPQSYDRSVDVSGWLMSEKYDGVRGFWDGQRMFSKNGKQFFPPPEFIRDLPPFPIEGELWGGRGTFEKTVSIVRRSYPHDGWLELKFAIFDVPEESGGFVQRINRARLWLSQHPSSYAFVIDQIPVSDSTEVQRELERIEKLGGEGLIVRKPDGLYQAGRSMEILKVKQYEDTEAVVIGHLPGKGKNQGRLGALLAELPNGVRFKIGSGFSDVERQSPPPLGSVVTFKYYGLYESGIPKFPSYLRIRQDAGF
jgi:DNA ligase-1